MVEELRGKKETDKEFFRQKGLFEGEKARIKLEKKRLFSSGNV